MTKQKLTADTAAKAVKATGSQRKAAAALNVSPSGLRYALATKAEEFVPAKLVSSGLPIDQLIERRCETFQRRQEAEESNKLLRVPVKVEGPIGIVHFGDPHLDDDGCNFPLLKKHVEIVERTPGLLGGCIGDLTNNWCGPLARLHAKQETKGADAVVLAKWFIQSVRWLYLIGGNHDLWTGDVSPIKFLTKEAGVTYKDHGARIALKFPNGRECRINTRHTFSGNSMWNANHGAVRAARLGHRDHIYASGHTHTYSYQKIPSPDCELMHHLLQIGAYKVYDDYADQNGFQNHNAAPAMVTIINPAKSELNWITVYDDVEEAADYLTWLRKSA